MFPGGGSFKVDGVHSDYFGMYYASWSYDVIPSIRSGLVDIAGRRGKQDNGSELSSRLLTLDLRVASMDAATRWLYMSRWAAAMNPETGPHKIELCDERPGWYLLVQPAGGSASPQLVLSQWTQSFECADPHWYRNNPGLYQHIFPGSPTYGIVINEGNTYVEPSIYIAGFNGQTVTNPSLTIGTATVSLFGVLHFGENWVVDVHSKTVTRNGVSDIANWAGTFPVIPGSQAGYDAGGLQVGLQWTDAALIGGYVELDWTPRLL